MTIEFSFGISWNTVLSFGSASSSIVLILNIIYGPNIELFITKVPAIKENHDVVIITHRVKGSRREENIKSSCRLRLTTHENSIERRTTTVAEVEAWREKKIWDEWRSRTKMRDKRQFIDLFTNTLLYDVQRTEKSLCFTFQTFPVCDSDMLEYSTKTQKRFVKARQKEIKVFRIGELRKKNVTNSIEILWNGSEKWAIELKSNCC